MANQAAQASTNETARAVIPEERLLALGSVALSGYDDTFSQLTDVDMKFGVLVDQTGAGKTAYPKLVQFVFGEARS